MLARCANIVGPCTIITCDNTYVSVSDVKLSIKRDLRKLESSIAGEVGAVLNKVVVEVKFKPVPVAGYAATLFPFTPADIGKSVFGCADCSMQIFGKDGVKLTLSAVGAVGSRTLNFGRKANLYGDVTFRAVVANAADAATLDSLATITSASWTAPSDAYNAAAWITRSASLTYGSGTSLTVTASASTDFLTSVAHGLANGATGLMSSTATLPAGLTAGTVYYVVNRTADTFQLALTSGGTPIDMTTAGTGTITFTAGPALGTITTESGVEFTYSIETEDKEDDLNGYYDTKIKAVKMSAKFRPNNLSVAQMRTLLPWDGAGAKPGLNMATVGYQLAVTHNPSAGGLQCVLPSAVPTESELVWGQSSSRDGDVMMQAMQGYSGSPTALFTITTV